MTYAFLITLAVIGFLLAVFALVLNAVLKADKSVWITLLVTAFAGGLVCSAIPEATTDPLFRALGIGVTVGSALLLLALLIGMVAAAKKGWGLASSQEREEELAGRECFLLPLEETLKQKEASLQRWKESLQRVEDTQQEIYTLLLDSYNRGYAVMQHMDASIKGAYEDHEDLCERAAFILRTILAFMRKHNVTDCGRMRWPRFTRQRLEENVAFLVRKGYIDQDLADSLLEGEPRLLQDFGKMIEVKDLIKKLIDSRF